MYEVIKNGEVVCVITNVCYVKYKSAISSWCVCEKDDSSAICVVPYTEEGEEPEESFYARLAFHWVDDSNRGFDLVELREIN